jgi:glutaredoxin 3
MDAQDKRASYVEIFSGPLCSYCTRAKAVLERRGLRYREVDVSTAEGRGEMAARLPHARTIPQIFIGGEHIGGCEDLERLDASGALGLVDAGGVLQ